MPIYSYECDKCGTLFDVMVKKFDERNEIEICPECGEVAKLVPTAAAFKIENK